MKNLFFFFLLWVTTSLCAQAPQAFNYQGIARDASGTPLANTTISLRLTILEGVLPGIEVYKEEHYVLTNKLGIFNLEVGHGASQVGLFENIQWGAGEHAIQIDIDPSGGQNFIAMGTAQLLSVPYALYAGSGNSQWKDNPKGIHYSDGNVGIGTNNPLQKLSVVGNDDDGPARNYVSIYNKSLSNRSAAILSLSAGNNTNQTNLIHLSETYDFGNNDFNDFGQLDSRGAGLLLTAPNSIGVIRFMTNHTPETNAPVERMRIASDGKIGIGTRNPLQLLSIEGNDEDGAGRNYVSISNTSLSNRSAAILSLSAGNTDHKTNLIHLSETYDFENNDFNDFGQLDSRGAGLLLTAPDSIGVIRFMTNHTTVTNAPIERMRISSNGNVGIGTRVPASKLQVTDGDVFIENINNGVIMKSPDGNCWRITVQDDGSLKTTTIACPN